MKFYNPSREQITAWVAKHFPDHRVRKGGAELVICSPFDDDDSYHFNISTKKAVCHDWRDGDQWAPLNKRTGRRTCTFLKFVQLYKNCSFTEAVREVCGHTKLSFPKKHQEIAESEIIPVKLPSGSEQLAAKPRGLAESIVLRWLSSRGISGEDVEKHKIHYLGTNVIWPYFEYDDIPVYWQLRSRLNKQFLFPDEREFGVTKGQFLYGFDDIEPARELVVVESIFNKFTLREQCVATGGADITTQQVQKIHLLGPRDGIILAPDNDLPGIKSVVKNGVTLRKRGFKVYYSLPPKLEYTEETDDGPAQRLTKDWNEIGQFVTGFDKVQGIMDKAVRELTMSELTRLQLYAGRADRLKKVIR